MNILDLVIVAFLLATFPLGVYVFAGKKIDWDWVVRTCGTYKWHILMLFGLFIMKSLIMALEAPFESRFGFDATPLIHGIEGDAVLAIQDALLNQWLTTFCVMVYIGSFLFIYVFSFLLFAYADRFKTASSLMFMFLLLLVISIPFYFLVIVDVTTYPVMLDPTSEAVVPGMRPLLYNYSPMVHDFFASYDTLNNCFPSMHIGYPCAILLYIHRNERGFRAYKWFLLVMTSLIGFAVVYLGVHWLVDLLAGVAVAAVAVLLTERLAARFWKKVYAATGREWRESDWT
jgi:membrane-associated phospholipid phosphatase